MLNDLPRLLLISDANLNNEGGGINRTLVNLFANYPPEQILLYVPQEVHRQQPPIPSLRRRVVTFTSYYLLPRLGLVGKLINPLLAKINYQLLNWFPLANKQLLEKFAPEVIVVCPNSLNCLIVGYKLSEDFPCPVIVYAMDDWRTLDRQRWLFNSGKQIISQLLQKSAAWLMISEQLKTSFSKHYQLTPQSTLIVHNPVDLSGKFLPEVKEINQGNFKIIYAGSIWQMHYDTLAIVAQAIFALRSEGKDIELVLHTPDNFWEQYQQQWQNCQVTNGSLIAYQELNKHLQQGDLLLVVSSFLPECEFLTRSSVQTKLTDYMASGRAILACGPSYSACNQFVETWDCGVICETNKVVEVKDFLAQQMHNRQWLQTLGKNAFTVVNEYFETKKVTNNLYQFIQQVSQQAKK